MAAIACLAIGACARPQGDLFPTLERARVWPAPPEIARIKLVGVLGGSGDLNAAVEAGEVIRAAFTGPRPPIVFSSPHGVAVSESGMVAVADSSGNAVHLIDLNDRTHRMISGVAEGDRFAVPVGVTWVGDRLFVTDAKRHEVIELDRTGSFRARFGTDALNRPVGITYVPSRKLLYVVDGGAHRILAFDLSGNVSASIGGRGAEPGLFNFPTHIATDGDRLLVADTGNFRVQLLDPDGNCLATIGKKGDGAGDLSLPKGVAFDRDGHVYVVDAHFENVQLFNTAGQLLMAFGEEGRDPASFSLPAGLAVDKQDRIWVADAGNRRLQVFQYLRAPS